MRWIPGGSSSNVEDRRGQSGIGRGMGLGGTVIVLILSLVFGRNLFDDGSGTGAGTPVPTQNAVGGEVQESPAEHKEVEFMTAVLNDVQGFWAQTLPNVGVPYRDAKLVLFRDITDSGCGTAQSATGPFYCPLDQKVYIDLSFFNELRQRLGAKGDFAEAYVLAHELGHHVQHLMGTDARVRQLQDSRPDLRNDLSVRLELQADCYAGVWAQSSNQRQNLEPGDIDEALGAAAAVGDDRLQRMTRGTVQPESFTHGTSAQRSTWFKRGFEGGRVESCDTFAGGR
jgi:hypothetical protein